MSLSLSLCFFLAHWVQCSTLSARRNKCLVQIRAQPHVHGARDGGGVCIFCISFAAEHVCLMMWRRLIYLSVIATKHVTPNHTKKKKSFAPLPISANKVLASNLPCKTPAGFSLKLVPNFARLLCTKPFLATHIQKHSSDACAKLVFHFCLQGADKNLYFTWVIEESMLAF